MRPLGPSLWSRRTHATVRLPCTASLYPIVDVSKVHGSDTSDICLKEYPRAASVRRTGYPRQSSRKHHAQTLRLRRDIGGC